MTPDFIQLFKFILAVSGIILGFTVLTAIALILTLPNDETLKEENEAAL